MTKHEKKKNPIICMYQNEETYVKALKLTTKPITMHKMYENKTSKIEWNVWIKLGEIYQIMLVFNKIWKIIPSRTKYTKNVPNCAKCTMQHSARNLLINAPKCI